ncbi:MAG: hypothetical protein HC802_07145, partial [Caldilineaceae bacterium]|nr:hypothetical protein [Caldilineaceae bacterium]
RMFVDEGEAMRWLILDFRFWIAQQPGAAQNAQLTAYADKILASFGDEPAQVEKPLLVEQTKIANPNRQSKSN